MRRARLSGSMLSSEHAPSSGRVLSLNARALLNGGTGKRWGYDGSEQIGVGRPYHLAMRDVPTVKLDSDTG